MKKLLTLCILFLFASSVLRPDVVITLRHKAGATPITRVAISWAADSSTADTSAGGQGGPINTSTANLLTAEGAFFGSNPASVTMADSVGGNSNIWTLVTSEINVGNGNVTIGHWCSVPTHVGATHNFTLTGVAISLTVEAWAGTGASCTPSGTPTHSSAGGVPGTTITPGSITPAAAGALCVTAMTNNIYTPGAFDWTVTSGYTLNTTLQPISATTVPIGSWYQIQSPGPSATDPPWAGTFGTNSALAACYPAP